jgi:hypothetical protein
LFHKKGAANPEQHILFSVKYEEFMINYIQSESHLSESHCLPDGASRVQAGMIY